MLERVFFKCKSFEIEILIDLHFMRFTKSENYIIRLKYLSLCVCVQSLNVVKTTRKMLFVIFIENLTKNLYRVVHEKFEYARI